MKLAVCREQREAAVVLLMLQVTSLIFDEIPDYCDNFKLKEIVKESVFREDGKRK